MIRRPPRSTLFPYTTLCRSVPRATTRTMTAEELARLPDDGHRYELIEGVLHRMAPTGFEHGVIAGRFVRHLGEFVDARKLGRVVGTEVGFVFDRDPLIVLAPDATFVRADRLPPPADRKGYLDVIPDLVVEVVAPYDTQSDIDAKVARYLAAGVRLVWVAYPDPRRVVAHRPGQAPRVFGDTDVLDGENVLPGF